MTDTTKNYTHLKNKHGIYLPIQPNTNEWIISKLSKNRAEFITEFTEATLQLIKNTNQNNPSKIHEEIANAMYLERIRLSERPWKVDPPDEKVFWKKANEILVDASLKKNKTELTPNETELLYNIINRYANEIAGNFNSNTFNFAQSVVPKGFGLLLNTAERNWRNFWRGQHEIGDRIKSVGDLEKIRELSQKGTLLLVPTHFSNLDSILVGWVSYSLGLPALLYGAGLNLFNSPILAYFMNRLGAYRVDRRKKNNIYLETLKMYSRLTLQKGAHSLFFPGGARSRAGQMETKLKLGLLGTAIDAQRLNYINSQQNNTEPKKIFVVPLIISYHFVLEASRLIDEQLKLMGKAKYYIDKDTFPSSAKTLQFLRSFVSQKSEIFLSFAPPMDIFGNEVDNNGNSIDTRGNLVKIEQYFMKNNTITEDQQRDMEYTTLLGDKIVQKYYQYNIIMSSHLVAFTAFEMLKKIHQKRNLDLFGLLRLPADQRIIPYHKFAQIVNILRNELLNRKNKNQVQLAPYLFGDIDRLIDYALKNLGAYHHQKALLKNENGDIYSDNMNLLYYYHNRLEGYDLARFIEIKDPE